MRSEVRRWHLFEVEEVRHRSVGQEWVPHWHPEWSIGAVIRGECRCSVDGRPMRAQAGDLVAIAPNVVHTGALIGTHRMAPVLVTMFYVPLAWFEQSGWAPPMATGWIANPGLAKSSEALRTSEDVHAWLKKAIPALRCTSPEGRSSTLPNPAERQLLRKVQQALLNGHVTVASLAEHCAISRERLHRVVRRWTGMGPAEYCRAIRINQARAMLLDGASVSSTAAACGFADQAHFTRWFRRAFGYTPGDLQSAARRNPG